MAVITFHRLFCDFFLRGLLDLSLTQKSSYCSYIVKSLLSCIFLFLFLGYPLFMIKLGKKTRFTLSGLNIRIKIHSYDFRNRRISNMA